MEITTDSFKSQLQDLIEERVQQARQDSGRRIDYPSVARGGAFARYKSTSRHFHPTLSVVAGNESSAVLGDFLMALFDIMEDSSCHFCRIQLIPTYTDQGAYSGDSRSPIPMISVHSVGYLLYRRQS